MSSSVDMHTHVLIPAAEALVADEPGWAVASARESRAMGPASAAVNREQSALLETALTDPGHRLAVMDKQHIDVQVVSSYPDHHYWADRRVAERYAVAVNEGVLDHCAAAPLRLVGLGTAPLQHPNLAATLLTEALASGLWGVGVSTHVEGRELADPDLEPFWDRAEELGAVIFVHPWGCTLGERLARSYLFNVVGNPAETAVALSGMMFSGLLDRHPGLRIVAAHGGGYLPTYLGRADHAWRSRPDARTCAGEPSSYLKRLWFDSLVYTPVGLRALIDAVGADRVLLGSDYPFDMGVTDPLERLAAAELGDAATAAVRGDNALDLLALASPHSGRTLAPRRDQH